MSVVKRATQLSLGIRRIPGGARTSVRLPGPRATSCAEGDAAALARLLAVPPGVVDAGLSDEHAPSRWMSCDASCCLAKSASAVRDSTPARAQVGSLGLYLRRRSGLKGFRRFAVPGPLATPEP
jgi:hypothetical protein